MIRSVLVPLDSSELAEQALSYAGPLAERFDAELHLLMAISEDAEASEHDEARAYLKSIAERYGDRCRIHVRLGNPAEQIVDASEELPDSMVVMTTHGRTGIGRWIYGSVADKVIRAVDVPVVLMRSGGTGASDGQIRTILAPLDGSAYSEAALNYAKQVARAFDAELHITRVAETANLYSTLGYETYAPGAAQPMADVVERMIEDIKQYITDVTARVRAEGYRAQGVVLEGFAGEQLIQYEREIEPDLVVMATRGRGGVERLIFGSVAERIVRAGRAPVLLVKPSGALNDSDGE
jgi:nucleotide-binding universal stress UspA family protein